MHARVTLAIKHCFFFCFLCFPPRILIYIYYIWTNFLVTPHPIRAYAASIEKPDTPGVCKARCGDKPRWNRRSPYCSNPFLFCGLHLPSSRGTMLWSRSFRPYLIDLCMCRLRAMRRDGVLDRVTVLHVFWSWTNSGSVWSCVLTLSPPRLPRLPLHPACCET